MFSVIRKTKKVDTIEYSAKGAYAHAGSEIAMENKRGSNVSGTKDAACGGMSTGIM